MPLTSTFWGWTGFFQLTLLGQNLSVKEVRAGTKTGMVAKAMKKSLSLWITGSCSVSFPDIVWYILPRDSLAPSIQRQSIQRLTDMATGQWDWNSSSVEVVSSEGIQGWDKLTIKTD